MLKTMFKYRCILLGVLVVVNASQLLSADISLVLDRVLGDPAFRHSSDLIAVVPLPDGKRVLTSANDGSARLWDLETGREVRRYVDDTQGYVWGICLHPDNKSFLTSGASGQVVKWDIEAGSSNVIYKLDNEKSIFRVAVSPDGKLLAIGAADQFLLWDMVNRKDVLTMTHAEKDAYAVCFLSKGGVVAAGFDDVGAFVKKVSDDSQVYQTPPDSATVYSLIASPDESALLVCTSKKGLLCIDTSDYSTKWEALSGKANIYAAAWSPDGTRVVAVCAEGGNDRNDYRFYVLDARDGSTVFNKPVNSRGNHYGIAYTVDGKYILCASGNVLAKYDAATGKRVFPAEEDADFDNSGLSAVVFSASGKRLFTDNQKGNGLVIIDAVKGTRIGVLQEDFPFKNLTVSTDGRFAAGTGESQIYVMDVEAGKPATIIYEEGHARSLAFASGARHLLVNKYEGVDVYEIPSGKIASQLDSMDKLSLQSVAAQSAGSLIAGAQESSVLVFDLAVRKQIARMNLPSKAGGVSFYPSNGTSILAGANTNLYLWIQPGVEGAGDNKEIVKAMAQLGGKTFSEREEATQYLISQGGTALEAIKKANVSDPEVKTRVERIRRSIKVTQIYGEPADTASCSFGRIGLLKSHPDMNLWVGITEHPSAGKIVAGDVSNDKIRILSVVEDINGPSEFCFAPDGVIYTANRNGTISVYKISTGK